MTNEPWFATAAHRRYGDVFTLRCAPGDQHLVFLNRREHIKEVFTGDPAIFHAGEGNVLLRTVMGPHSVLLVDDEIHLRARKLLMPAFNGAALRSYEGLVGVLAKSEVDSWHPDETLVGLDRMNALTLEIIMQVVFGVTDEEHLARLRPVVNNTVNIGPLTLLSWAYPKLQRYGPWRSYMANQEHFDEMLYAEIAERRGESEERADRGARPDGAERRDASDLDQREDVLSRLLLVGAGDDEAHEPLSDAELRDQLVTLLLAGHETTASALSWTLHELAQNPDVQRRARRAADEGDRKYLEAVIKEAMRRHAVIDQVRRVLKQDVTVAGYDLPAGTTVVPSVRLAHQSTVNYPDPDAFRPERFLEGEVPSNAWLPFGGGVRRCLGAGFSLMEGTIILGEVLQRYGLRPDPDGREREHIRNITTVPKRKARIVLAAR
ncbi:MAG: cytochrome P450 [Actinomycetia bacterium]|nr:cytochrome P450 [Actinomycetes bacterium]